MKRRGFITALLAAFLAPLFRLFRPKPFIMVDELGLLRDEIFEAAKKNVYSGKPFDMIGIGSPDSFYDAAGVFSFPKDGWDSVENDEKWETSTGHCIRFDGSKKPNCLL
jgi:hypothetical protein